MTAVKDALQRVIDGLCSLPPRRRSKGPRVVVVRRPGSPEQDAARAQRRQDQAASSAPPPVTIRVATFNAAMFSMAPAVPPFADDEYPCPCTDRAGRRRLLPTKGILKAERPPSSPAKQLRVSINLQVQDDDVTTSSSRSSSRNGGTWKDKGKAVDLPEPPEWWRRRPSSASSRSRSAAEVLREVGADIIGLQNVRAEEERGMRPLSGLAERLGMSYAFAESWAPQYGNAVLSRWPIKRWKAHRVADQSDFRNVLRATIEVPDAGEINFHCTHLDHLDEGWRMKQVDAIIRSADGPHILAGGLNALDGTDYSAERWADIVKYYEEIGKPTPKVEVMKYLKGKQYVDAKDFAGECEAVVVVAKGQDVQGTCKYGTRVDYILTSPNSPYKFVPGSYTVISSKGTSDHHIVRVDVTIPQIKEPDAETGARKQRVVKMGKKSSTTKGIWGAAAK